MSDMLQSVCRMLEDGKNLVLATILSQSGSTPRTAGTKMIVLSDGSIIGTVGGGLVEAAVQKAAAEVWRTGEAQLKLFDLTGADADSMDMICGGRLEILIEYITSDPSNLRIYKELSSALHKREKVFLITVLGEGSNNKGQLFRRAVLGDGTVLAENTLSNIANISSDRLNQLVTMTGKSRYPVVFDADNQKIIVEPFFGTGTVYLYGAGHVSQQVASLAALVDFRTIVLDDREEFANRERFKQADRVEVITSFANAFDDPVPDVDSYVVIVTRGHSHDKTVLGQVLQTKAKYIGMIGSKRKRDAIYRALLSEGFTQEDLLRVNCPIGLEIGAETPEEIAVSIVAELIKHRAQKA